MASKAGAIRAGKAFVELFADDTALQRTLARVSTRLKTWGAGFAKIGAGFSAVGASIITTILGASKVFADAGSELADMSARTGIAVESLSALKYAAEQSGGSMELLETGVKSMQRFLQSAFQGSKGAIETLGILGLSIEQFGHLDPEGQFNLLADALSRVSDPTERAALAMKAFGKAGQQLLPLLSGGVTGLASLKAEAEALGLTMSTEDAAAAEAFGDALDRLKAQLKQVVVTVGSAVVPTLMQFLSSTQGMIRGAIDWASANKPLVASIFAMGVAATATGAALIGVGGILSAAGMAVAGLSAGIGMLGSALTFILTPAGAVLAIVGSLAAAFGYAVAKSLDWAAALSTVRGAWGGISAALASGDLQKAADIAFQGIKVAWLQLTLAMRTAWQDVVDSVARGIANVPGVAAALGVESDALKKTLTDTQALAGPHREMVAEREKLAAMIAAANDGKPAGDLPAASASMPVASTAAPDGFLPPKIATQSQRMQGTLSANSERMFGGGFNRAADTFKTWQEIAESTKATAAEVKRLAKNAMVYTRG